MKLLVILGPTATGKSDLAVQLALKFNGEIVSADSRQVYKGLDIGTGKITKEEMCGVPHYCLDIANPSERFTVINWKRAAEKAVKEIAAKNKLPIICGGTGFYISALIDNLEFPDIEVDEEEQKQLETKTCDELLVELKKTDSARADQMLANNEYKNKRRLIRAILIAKQLGKVPPVKSNQNLIGDENPGHHYEATIIGLTLPDIELKERIKTRLIKRLDIGMIDEAKNLNKNGLTFDRMNELGLEYRYLAKYLNSEFGASEQAKQKLIDILSTKIWQYAKRQKTWFKRDKRIKWFKPSEIEQIKNSLLAR